MRKLKNRRQTGERAACDIISAILRQIICDTQSSIAEGAKHIGGAGANLEFTTGVGLTVDTDQKERSQGRWLSADKDAHSEQNFPILAR